MDRGKWTEGSGKWRVESRPGAEDELERTEVSEAAEPAEQEI